MTSSGGEPKIYLRGVTPHTLLHGGLGHRPPPYEELILFGSYLGVLDLSLWESAQIWPFVSILAFLGKLSPSGFEFYPKPQLVSHKPCLSKMHYDRVPSFVDGRNRR